MANFNWLQKTVKCGKYSPVEFANLVCFVLCAERCNRIPKSEPYFTNNARFLALLSIMHSNNSLFQISKKNTIDFDQSRA